MKVYNQAQLENNFDADKWQPILDENPHPEVKMQAHLRASFEVLKEEQNSLLAGLRNYTDEKSLIKSINDRTEQYIKDSQSPDTWERKIWDKATIELNMKKDLSPKSQKEEQAFLRYILLPGIIGALIAFKYSTKPQ